MIDSREEEAAAISMSAGSSLTVSRLLVNEGVVAEYDPREFLLETRGQFL